MIGNITVERERMGGSGKSTIKVTFPGVISDDAMRKLGLYAVRIAEDDQDVVED